MTVELLSQHHMEFLSLKGDCTGPSESTHVKMPHCWKSHALANYVINSISTGMLWQKVKQVYNDGVQGHFDSLYNYFDFAVLTVYITSFTLRFLTLIKVRIDRRFAYCKGGNFNIHIWAWFGCYIC